MPRVSIIVPIYKAEPYLHRCIDSILAQTFTDWELLLIDDGSPDRSGDICDEYAKKDKRIRVFHKENGGVSSARNLGLEKMQGEYVTFVDADDWISRNTLQLCSSHFNKYEIIRFSMVYVKSLSGENKRKLILPSSDSKDDILQRILERKSLLGVWGALYKAELFNNPPIRFDTKLIMAEDWLVLCLLVDKCHSIIDMPDVCYCYNQMNEDSCSNNPSSEKVIQCFIALYKIVNKLGNSKLYMNSCVNSFQVLTKALLMSVLNESNTPKGFQANFRKIEYFYKKVLDLLVAFPNSLNTYNKCYLKFAKTGVLEYIFSLSTCFKWIKYGCRKLQRK